MNPAPASSIRDGELNVDGERFLALGGELHNSSSSTAEYMTDKWARIAAMNVNTVLASVSWAQWEPVEGEFDPMCVDHLIESARKHGLRLVLLWFGSWKNGVSSYCPDWIKLDPQRFPLARSADGDSLQALSVFADSNADADARAFAALMAHLRDVDGAMGTVILVQVENEVGLLGTARDHSELAERAWSASPPEQLGAAATWSEIDADQDRAGETFMAWHYASYIDRVAAAGSREWPLPMYANAWLNSAADPAAMSGGQRPGEYPSGGPVPHMIEVWKAAAPTLKFLSPDIYTDDVADRAMAYAEKCPVLFLPELKRTAPGELFNAIGELGAVGVSPFGIDSTPDDEADTLARAYGQLASIAPSLLAARLRGDVAGFYVTESTPTATAVLGGYRFAIERDFDPQQTGDHEDGYGVLIHEPDGSFLLAGHGIVLRPSRQDPERPAWVLNCRELDPAADLRVLRELNGDETGGGEIIRITRTNPPGFGPIPISASATGVLRFRLYGRPV